MEFITIFFIAGIITGTIGAFLGDTVNKPGAGFFLGLFLGPIGWIIVFLLPRNDSSHNPVVTEKTNIDSSQVFAPTNQNTKINSIFMLCPACAEEIKLVAKKCRFCGHEFTDAD